MPDDKRKEWIEYLTSLRGSNYDYHHHKETVTFTIAGLYIGAILTIDFKGEEAPYIWGIVGFVALFLVRYQFYWRYRANAIVLACNKLLTQLISGTAFQENEWKLDSDKSFPDSCRPIALNKEIKECRKPWAGLWKSPAFLEAVILAATEKKSTTEANTWLSDEHLRKAMGQPAKVARFPQDGEIAQKVTG